jgi:hypothetical protein
MCYPSPGPRCYSAASRKLVLAQQAYDDAALAGSTVEEMLQARAVVQSAREAVNITTEGIAQLKHSGKVEAAAHYKRRRAQQIEAWKTNCHATAADPTTPFHELSQLVASNKNPMAARLAAIKNLHRRHPAWSSFTLKQVEGMLLHEARSA